MDLEAGHGLELNTREVLERAIIRLNPVTFFSKA